MAKQKLTDNEAKVILRTWPQRTKEVWGVPSNQGFWLRAQPKAEGSRIPTPTIRQPGSDLFKTQPDGMWLYLGQNLVDVIVVEACGFRQNLADKRSRYAPSTSSLLVMCPLSWLSEEITLQKGGKARRWVAARSVKKAPKQDLLLPIRHLRILYAIPNDLYREWTAHSIGAAHEFFCRHSALDSFNSQKMQSFLRRMSLNTHFHTARGK